MSSTAKKIWKSFQSKKYRHAYVSAHVADTIAAQIFSLRKINKWSQQKLADKVGMKQSRISALENSVFDNVTIGTLKRLSEAFNVALTVRFISFGELANWISNMSKDKISVPSYKDEAKAMPPQRMFHDAPITIVINLGYFIFQSPLVSIHSKCDIKLTPDTKSFTIERDLPQPYTQGFLGAVR